MAQDSYKICPTCNFFCHINEDKNYCPFCGQKLITHCPRCGAPVTFPYSKFCEKCGTRLRVTDQPLEKVQHKKD